MLFAEVAATSVAVAAAPGRREKAGLIAGCLRACDPAELPVVVAWLSGRTRQRRTGLGWAALRDLPAVPPRTGQAVLTVREVDAALDRISALAGEGATAARRDLLAGVVARSDESERRLLHGLVAGEVRQGAQAGVMLDAVAGAFQVPVAAVRRAMTLTGDPAAVAVAACTGGAAALDRIGLQVGRPLAPMLAQSAPDLAAALERTGPAALDWKLDGVRIQAHRSGSDVALFTRTLDEVTGRLPEVVAAVAALPVTTAVLDAEAIALRPDGRPQPFQVTSSRVARRDTAEAARETPVDLVVFDALHLDGTDLLDEPADRRRTALEAVAPAGLLVPRHVVDDPADPRVRAAAGRFADDALARGHEGGVVKSLAAGYALGRRGAGWVKVKPRVTLDLVVLAAEWGHGRRTGLLSNLHLGARDPAGRFGPPGGFVMLGKTFKGLTDAMLAWQTDHLRALAVGESRWEVAVRPELVVEVAFDGVQTSPRYPAGVALRFARVLAHRADKPAGEADTIETVLAHHDPGDPAGDGDGTGPTDRR